MSGHGGEVYRWAQETNRRVEEILDFSASINPLGSPACVERVVRQAISRLVHYPEPYAEALCRDLAYLHGVGVEQVVAGNGTTELLFLLPRAFECRQVLVPAPSYSDYARASTLAGLEVEHLPLRPEEGFRLDLEGLERRLHGGALVFLGQPNNPTGQLCDREALRRLVAARPDVSFVVDEAFADFVEGYGSLAGEAPANLVVLRSLTKIYAVPGLRLGYAVADRETAARLRALVPPWSVNVLGQEVGRALLQEKDYVRRSQQIVARWRNALTARLRALPEVQVWDGEANYLLLCLGKKGDAVALARRLLDRGIAVRPCANFVGLDQSFLRVAVRTESENEWLVRALGEALGHA